VRRAARRREDTTRREVGEDRLTGRPGEGPALRLRAGGWPSHAPIRSARPGHEITEAALRYGALLRGVARRILGDEDLAQDAVQEALLCLWQAAEVPEPLRGWLVQTVVHRSLHARRSRDRRRRWESEAGRLLAGDCPLCNPETELDVRRGLEALGRAMDALSEEQRAVFVLREIEGLDYREIAGRLALPLGTVRSRLNRARRRLQSDPQDETRAAGASVAGGTA